MEWFPRISLKFLSKSPPFDAKQKVELKIFIGAKGDFFETHIMHRNVVAVASALGIEAGDSYELRLVKVSGIGAEEFIP